MTQNDTDPRDIDPRDVEWALEDSVREGERWTELSINSTLRTADLHYRNVDREFDLILALTTLSVAFLTLVLPNSDTSNLLLLCAGASSLMTAILGIFFLVGTINRDTRYISEDGEWELKIFKKYQQRAANLILLLRGYTKSQTLELRQKLLEIAEEREKGSEDVAAEAKKRSESKKQDKTVTVLLSVKLLFWFFFSLSVALISIWIVLLFFI